MAKSLSYNMAIRYYIIFAKIMQFCEKLCALYY